MKNENQGNQKLIAAHEAVLAAPRKIFRKLNPYLVEFHQGPWAGRRLSGANYYTPAGQDAEWEGEFRGEVPGWSLWAGAGGG